MNIEKAVKCILDGNAVLFVGAGFSRDATNLEHEPMSKATELCIKLCEEMKTPYSDNLSEVSDLYLNRDSENWLLNAQKLIEMLISTYTCEKYVKNNLLLLNKNIGEFTQLTMIMLVRE